MCICATESTRPRLFNGISVLLLTFWVLVVSAVAHTVPAQSTEQSVEQLAPVEVFVSKLIN